MKTKRFVVAYTDDDYFSMQNGGAGTLQQAEVYHSKRTAMQSHREWYQRRGLGVPEAKTVEVKLARMELLERSLSRLLLGRDDP